MLEAKQSYCLKKCKYLFFNLFLYLSVTESHAHFMLYIWIAHQIEIIKLFIVIFDKTDSLASIKGNFLHLQR